MYGRKPRPRITRSNKSSMSSASRISRSTSRAMSKARSIGSKSIMSKARKSFKKTK